ncbi:MAG: hypothetical protein H6828_13655 [Planctomycetes bacterium]|nr:hypothetical protein [Planctomycetota bacterium]
MWAPEPLGHRATVEGLWRARAQGHLPHALLFHGPAGVGKFAAARWFVQGLFCAHGPAAPCGACGPCKRLAAQSFADLFVLDPLELGLEHIQVGWIAHREGGPAQSVEDFLALRPLEGGARVVIVREAERANPQAQNALLKTLEEPGQDALLVLECSRPDQLLETVRSRCVAVAFAKLAPREAAEVLAREGLVGAHAERCVQLAEGAPGRALALAREGAPAVLALVEQVLDGALDPFAGSLAVLEAAGEFTGATPAAQKRNQARAALELCLSVLRDALRWRAGAAEADLAHGAVAARLVWSDARLAAAQRALLALRGEVELNLAPEAVLDRAFLALREAGREARAANARPQETR